MFDNAECVTKDAFEMSEKSLIMVLSKKAVLVGVLAVVLFGGLAFVTTKDAYALRLTMKRIVFEGPVRTETLMLVNNQSTEVTYRIGWRSMRMTEDRVLKAVEEGEDTSDLNSADDMIRFAPRRLTLAPGASQQIRLMLRRPRDLPEGEYRSHLWITPEAQVEEFGAQRDIDQSGSEVKLSMLTGVTLPIFVRHGTLTVKGGIENAKAVRKADGSLDVFFTVTREGNRSLYGDIDIICASANGAVLQQTRGNSVYTEVTRRNFNLKIPKDAHSDVSSCKQIEIRYIAESKDSFYEGGVIASATTPVN